LSNIQLLKRLLQPLISNLSGWVSLHDQGWVNFDDEAWVSFHDKRWVSFMIFSSYVNTWQRVSSVSGPS